MLAKKAVREVMERKQVGTNLLADRIGKPARLVCDRLSLEKSENISVEKLTELLRAMDYKVVIMPRETRLGADWIEIE